ncbi:MAG: 50S ribosomal protein L1 [Actinomycetota bacterium]|nr:50S ribosomal protein L1 [Actinomycetota bacterium]
MGKKRDDAAQRLDRERAYPPGESLDMVKSLATASFDETIEAAFNLGIDARQADQAVRGTVSLPHGTGKAVKVLVFAVGDQARAAQEAGADVVGGSDLAAKVESGAQPTDWDVTIAAPSMMAEVGKLGRVLGPRGLMPNPKAGTVTDDIGKAVEEFKAGRVEYRNDRFGNVHVPVGKVSFDGKQLRDNLAAVVDELMRVKPAAAKGRYIRKLTVASTMGIGVKIDVGALDSLVDSSQ